jgi:Fe2+ or Zn2+ uptake regulation protein
MIEHKQHLVDNGIRPSVIRLNVYQFLFNSISHPTADDIYKGLVDVIPTLSKTSIYNVLSVFVEKGIVNEVLVNTNEMRYEVIHHQHSHFVCNECKQLFDIPYQPVQIVNDTVKGFIIDKSEVIYKGLCPKCQKS